MGPASGPGLTGAARVPRSVGSSTSLWIVDAVVIDGDSRRRDDFFAVVFGGGEVDVVGLPGERGQAHVDVGIFQLVEAAAFVVFSFEAERIEHLHFVAALQIDAAVAAGLAAVFGHVGQAELDVEFAACRISDCWCSRR